METISMKRAFLVLIAGVFILAAADQVFAHHSFAATYVTGKRISVEGTVKEFVWRNPHSFLRIDVAGADGMVETWTMEWGSVSQLSQSSLTRTSLHVGDKIIVTGEPARDPGSHRVRIWEVSRPVDGWSWKGQVD
jgi:hypothetical protein